MTKGYSGADIKLVCKEAAMQPVREVFDKLEAITEDQPVFDNVQMNPIKTMDVKTAISKTKPSAKLYAERYVKWQAEFGSV